MFNDAGGDYNHPIIGRHGPKKITFKRAQKIACLHTSSERMKFDADCEWIRFDLENFFVTWGRLMEQKDMTFMDISAPRKDPLAALKFFFRTINNPEYAPVSQLTSTV